MNLRKDHYRLACFFVPSTVHRLRARSVGRSGLGGPTGRGRTACGVEVKVGANLVSLRPHFFLIPFFFFFVVSLAFVRSLN